MFFAKLLISGNVVEFYKGNYPVHLPKDDNYSHYIKMWEKQFSDEVDPGIRDRNSFFRSRRNARRLIFCNAWQWNRKDKKPFPPFFLTLTFEDNIKDLKVANRVFSKFIQRLNYELGHKEAYLQYIGIPEFQERGAIHYHVIVFNLPYIKNRVYKTILDIWGEGRIELKKISSLDTLIHYLSKYMVKEAEDGRLIGRKRYFVSRNIKRPLIINDFYTSVMVSSKLVNRLDYEKEFEAPFIGLVQYQRFILKDDESILDLDLDQEATDVVLSVIKEPNLKLSL